MKKVNFNQLKSVKTPENWIENTIKIPKKNKKKPVYMNPYVIASAACFVFCCALCAVVFSYIGTDTPAPIAPIKSSETFTSDVTDSTTPSSNLSIIQTIPNPITDIISSFQTQRQTGSEQKSTNPSDSTKATIQDGTDESPSNSQSVVTSQNPSETGGNSSDNTGNSDNPTIPDIPETIPTQPVTDPTEPNTDAPEYTEPGIPPSEESTIEGSDESFTSSIYFHYSPEICTGDEEYYCHIVSAAGQPFSVKYSSTERATVAYTSDGIKIQYNPYGKGLYLHTGYYYLTFYDNYGFSYTCYAYLGNQSVYIYQ